MNIVLGVVRLVVVLFWLIVLDSIIYVRMGFSIFKWLLK